jgi:hypothetical protein
MSTSRALANLLYTAAGALAGFHLAQRALQNRHPAPLPPLVARWLEHGEAVLDMMLGVD